MCSADIKCVKGSSAYYSDAMAVAQQQFDDTEQCKNDCHEGAKTIDVVYYCDPKDGAGVYSTNCSGKTIKGVEVTIKAPCVK